MTHPGFIDPPALWDGIDAWRAHLAFVESLPVDDPLRAGLLDEARATIAELERDRIAAGGPVRAAG